LKRVTLALLAASITPAAAQEAPHIWPAPGLYGLEHSVCDDGAPAPATAQISQALCPALDAAHKAAISTRFTQIVLAQFPGAEAMFASHMPTDATPRAKLAGTLIAELRISRATIWSVRKPAAVDGFLAITLTLDLVNAASGEVVFSRHRNMIASGQFPAATIEAEIAAQFPERLNAALVALVGDAAAAWHPYQQQSKVVGEVTLSDGKAWVIDKGRASGLRSGNDIGVDGRVLYAGPSYAVVRPTLGRYNTGDLLARTLVAPVDMLARPSVLVSVGQIPQGYAASYLSEVLEDALSAGGTFAPMPVTPAFTSLRIVALSEAHAQAVAMDSRALPDFVASVNMVVLPAGHFRSNVPGVTTARFEAHVFVSLVDRTGRIIATFHGVNRIEEQMSDGMGFSDVERQNTVLQNALIDAASKMAAWHPQPEALAVSMRGGNVFIADPANALPLDATMPVLRNYGHIGGVREDVLAPFAQLTSQAPADGGVIAVDADPIPYTPRNGDVVALDAEGPPLAGRGGLTQCMGPDGQPLVDDRGRVPVQVWPVAAEGIFAANAKWPVRSSALATRLAPLAVSFKNWDRFAPALIVAADRCFTPVLSVTPEGTGYGMAIGYTLRHGSDAPAGSGLHVVVTPAALPAGTMPDALAAQLQVDLATNALPLAAKVAAGLKLPVSGGTHP
jgi:hypothetical protein